MDVFEKGLFYNTGEVDYQNCDAEYSNFVPAIVYGIFADKAEKKRYEQNLADKRNEWPFSSDPATMAGLIATIQQYIAEWEGKSSTAKSAGDKRVSKRNVAAAYVRLDEVKNEYKKLQDAAAAAEAVAKANAAAQAVAQAANTPPAATATSTSILPVAATGNLASVLPATVGGVKTNKLLLYGAIGLGVVLVIYVIKK